MNNEKIAGIWADKYEAYCEGRLADPYPLYAWLLEHQPVHWSERMQSWFLVRYADVTQMLSDPRMSSDRAHVNMNKLPSEMQKRCVSLQVNISNWLGFMDEPRHMEVRRFLAKVFTPNEALAAEDRMKAISKELVSQLGYPRADLVEELAHPLPLSIVGDLLGVPEKDRKQFVQAINGIGDFVGEAGPNVIAAAERAHEGLVKLEGYFKGLIAQSKQKPMPGLITALATTVSESMNLGLEQILGLCVFIFEAGQETSKSLISSSALMLLQNPEFIARLQANPSLMPTAIEEFLRAEPPIPLISRVAREDLEYGGQKISAGETVIACVGAANRDPLVFPEPNRIILDRSRNRHLSFGWAQRFCLGAHLARAEARCALTAVLDRLANSRLEDPVPAWHDRSGFRALRELWIKSA